MRGKAGDFENVKARELLGWYTRASKGGSAVRQRF
jgi:hypothetical protein